MLRPYRSPCWDLVHVEHPGLSRCPGHVSNPPAGERVQQARLADVGAADEGEFGKRGVERDVGARERADETGFGLGQASFFWRGRSVTSSGARPAVATSAGAAQPRTDRPMAQAK